MRRRQEAIARENERMRGECDLTQAQLKEFRDEAKEAGKRHIEEIDNMRLAHQQEIYMMKRLQK